MGQKGVVVLLPEIALAEVASALARGTDDSRLAARWVGLLRRVPYFRFVEIDTAVGDLAAQVAAERRIRGCDAIYVAAAMRYGAALVTLDEQQLSRVPPTMRALTPSEVLEVEASGR